MRWNGQEYSDDIKKSIYVLLTDMEKANALTMNNTDYANKLKKLHNGIIQGLRFKYQSVVMYCTVSADSCHCSYVQAGGGSYSACVR